MLIVTAMGTVITLVSFAALSWYSIVGPDVVSNQARRDGQTSNYVSLGYPTIAFVVGPDAGRHHSAVTWVLVAFCVASAVGAWRWQRARLPLGLAGIVLAAALIGTAALDALAADPGLGDDPYNPIDAHLVIHPGFWLAEFGLAMLLFGSILAVNNVLRMQSLRAPS
jgi:hypothetical protein